MKKILSVAVLLFGLCLAVCSFNIPKGWFKAGSAPEKYDMGSDPGSGRTGKTAATIQSKADRIKGFGTLMQNFAPEKYLGKKIRMSGYMKSVDVENWAGFWLRVDGPNRGKELSFDNMHDRAVTGNTKWTKYEIVLDVPQNATNIAFGALLDGTGKIWFDDIKFETAGSGAQTTGGTRKLPQNLNFEE